VPAAPNRTTSAKRTAATPATPAAPARRRALPTSERPRIRLEDPREIRALAHPARLAVLDELFAGRELTATECAELAGLSPSAMSYHLRALERAGIVERAESQDGRERPWRAAGSGIEVHSQPDSPLAGAAASVFAHSVLNEAQHQLGEWLAGAGQEEERWREAAGFSSARLWLTLEEAEQIAGQVMQIVETYRGRTEQDHPDDARRMRLGFLFFPIGDPPR
jgi:DNA-binding transcriptional ArsR family regulator